MSFQAYLDSIEDKTGLTPRQLLDIAKSRGYGAPDVKPGAILDRFKADCGLGRGHHASPTIIQEFVESAPWPSECGDRPASVRG